MRYTHGNCALVIFCEEREREREEGERDVRGIEKQESRRQEEEDSCFIEETRGNYLYYSWLYELKNGSLTPRGGGGHSAEPSGMQRQTTMPSNKTIPECALRTATML